MWLAFLALNIIGLTTYNLILRKSLLEKIDSFTLATIMQTGIAIPMIFVIPFYFPDFNVYSPKLIIFSLAIISFIVTLHISNVKSLQYLEAKRKKRIDDERNTLGSWCGFVCKYTECF